ncbi:MAG: hypothetical protein D3923_08140 [Candidatus Electrothrix sp. AR3]|nr:hypothetical protein [Candidatus Electrothrix sp. AR3]
MCRGGSWINNGRNCRSANRNRNELGNRNNRLGFRLARARGILDRIIRPAPYPVCLVQPDGKKQMIPGM